jgi:predicted amidohydrolase YtcJ
VVDPDELRDLVERADANGFQVTAHAIGDEAIDETLSVFERTDDPAGRSHRIEHAEMCHDDHIDRLAASGVVASCQPNFLQWADEGGLYDQRLGVERRTALDRFATMVDAGVTLAFGSDCMPMDPLRGVHLTVNAPVPEQRLSVTEALRAYTHGAAYAGHDEHRMGTVEVGKIGDFVVLERSPWEHDDGIVDIDVALTVVDGAVVYDGR